MNIKIIKHIPVAFGIRPTVGEVYEVTKVFQSREGKLSYQIKPGQYPLRVFASECEVIL